jgi:hypothetical protein
MVSEIPPERLDPNVGEILALLRYRLARADQVLGCSLK